MKLCTVRVDYHIGFPIKKLTLQIIILFNYCKIFRKMKQKNSYIGTQKYFKRSKIKRLLYTMTVFSVSNKRVSWFFIKIQQICRNEAIEARKATFEKRSHIISLVNLHDSRVLKLYEPFDREIASSRDFLSFRRWATWKFSCLREEYYLPISLPVLFAPSIALQFFTI